ncbi:MAG: hypothetical protein O8C63_12710 [Candidatus Methanoperedens sp.]|nr:hypothetical protein [Candidatus Methanoperedens sp.]
MDCNSKLNDKSDMRLLSIVLIIALLTVFAGCIGMKKDQIPPEMSYYFNYDDDGRLSGYVDAEGNSVRHTYDDNGQIIETSYKDKQIHYKYDALGDLVAVKDGEGFTDFQYDAFGRLMAAKYNHSPEREVKFEYDPWGNVEKVKILDSSEQVVQSVGYEYDLLSRLKSVEIPQGLIKYSYKPEENKIIREFPNGIKSTFIYSSQMLPISIKHEDKIGNLLTEYKYEYDSSRRVIRAIENFPEIGIQDNKYEWDNRGYLTGWTKPDGMKISYTYNAMGNRISKIDSTGTLQNNYDNFGRLTQTGNFKFEWDKTGKLTKQIEGKSITKIGYNGMGLPSVIKTPDMTIRYDWDVAGNMISKQQGDKITHILPNPLSSPGSDLAEFDKMGHMTTSYVYGNSLLGQQDANNNMQYFLEDGFRSIRQITSMNGKILGQRDYSPFGEPYAVKGDNVGDFYSSGVRFLPEIKKYFVGNRLYDSSSGRYLSHDTESGYSDRFDSSNENNYLMQLRDLTQLRLTLEEHPIEWAGEEGIKAIWRNAFRQNYANIGRQWGPLFEGGYGESGWRMGRSFGDVFFATFSFGNLVSNVVAANREQRLEVAGRGGLKLMGETFGGRFGPVGSLAGGYIGIFVGEGAAHVGRFYGTRMDRPYWWWSPMKWIPQKEYLQRLEEQGRPKTTVMPQKDSTYYIGDIRNNFYPLCFPFCDDGNGGGGGGAGVNPLPQTPFSNEKELGGIELSAKAIFIGDLGKITATVYDSDNGSVVLVGDGNISLPTLSQEDLRVALELALAGKDAKFSLDPADPKHPKGDWFKAVYIPEDILKGTKFGNDLFEADWLLKQYSFGVNVDENGETSKRVTKVGGFKDIFDLGFESFNVDKKETWNRFWIVNDKATLRKTDNAIYFDTIDMKVKTEEQHFTGKNLKDTGKKDPDALKFAEFFTAHYNEFAEESHSLERLKEMAKAVAMANWLVSSGIPIDMSWFSESQVKDEKFEEYMNELSKRPNFKISETDKGKKFVDLVHSLSENQEKRTETATRTMYLFGGVDLKVTPDYISDDGQTKRIREKVKEAIRENPGQTRFDFQDGKQKFKAVVLPITKSGRSLWEDSTGGILDADFTRNDEGKIQSFKFETIDNWIASADRTNNGGSELIITTPNKHTFHYLYDSEGYLHQLNVDGKKFADYQYNSQTRTTTIDYDRWKEQVAYDKDGRVQSYTRVPLEKGQQQSETIQFNYDQKGLLKEINYGELEKIKFEYKGDLLTSAKTPWGEFAYTYDSDNRFRTISESGNIANFQYDGNSLNKIVVNSQGQTADAIFVKGLLNEIHGFNGEYMKYEYNEERLLTNAVDSQGAKSVYHYDDKLRLQRIELPGGSAIEYVYGMVGKGENTKERLLKTIIYPVRSE